MNLPETERRKKEKIMSYRESKNIIIFFEEFPHFSLRSLPPRKLYSFILGDYFSLCALRKGTYDINLYWGDSTFIKRLGTHLKFQKYRLFGVRTTGQDVELARFLPNNVLLLNQSSTRLASGNKPVFRKTDNFGWEHVSQEVVTIKNDLSQSAFIAV